ncbi:MAG: hypothetical protein K2K98_02820 [Muribaculaceae bacterium]|nr:hypothetical protein [Muribaculaceae bacterium]
MSEQKLNDRIQYLTEAFRKAFEIFNYDICNEKRLINVINDFHGFKEFPSAQFVLNTMIELEVLYRLYKHRFNSISEIQNFVQQETSKIIYQHGFSEEIIISILSSFLDSIDCNAASLKILYPRKRHSKRIPKKTGQLSIDPLGSYYDPDDPLDIRNISFDDSSINVRDIILRNIIGKWPGEEYEYIANEEIYTLTLKCKYGNENSVKVFVVPKYKDDCYSVVDNIIIQYRNLWSIHNMDRRRKLKQYIEEMFEFLDRKYGTPKITINGDLSHSLNRIIKWYCNESKATYYSAKLRAYCLDQGIVYCTLDFFQDSYRLLIHLVPKRTELSDNYNWRHDSVKHFEVISIQ